MNIVAIGGGGFRITERWGYAPTALSEFALSLTGKEAPKVCGVYTATGDPAERILNWHKAWEDRPEKASHLALYPMPNHDDVRAHLLAQDAIYVGGGSVVNLLALWRAHGLHDVFREVAEAGVVLWGTSAGMLCWFDGGITDSYGPDLATFDGGVGLIPASGCPHYDEEALRRPTYQAAVAAATIPGGWAADGGVGLHFTGPLELAEAVADRPDAAAWRVDADGQGGVMETRIHARRLNG
jgi:peptidase E